jgi:hypothetical protein
MQCMLLRVCNPAEVLGLAPAIVMRGRARPAAAASALQVCTDCSGAVAAAQQGHPAQGLEVAERLYR